MFKSKSSCVSPKMQGNDKLEHLRIFLGCKIPKNKGLEKTSAVDFCRAGLFGQSWNFIRSVWLLLLPVYLPYIMRGTPDLEIP